MNYSRWNPKRSAKYVYHTGTLASSIARAGTPCVNEEGRISNSSITQWTFILFLNTSSRKEDLMDIDMVKKPGDREYYITNQLKKKCKKKFFQGGIHDRFIRDEQFPNRMIENGRDEELCRQMDALADEDHTHLLTTQEYSFYKSKWWLQSNSKVLILCH